MEILSVQLFWTALFGYALSMVGYFFYLAYRKPIGVTLGNGVAVASAGIHAASLILRWITAGHAPYTNMYEYSSLFAWLAVLASLAIYLIYRIKSIGGFATAIAVLLMGSGWLLYSEPGPLVPALKSFWLDLHVFTMVLSSGVFSLAFVFGALYMLKERKLRLMQVATEGNPHARSARKGKSFLDKMPALDSLDSLSFDTIKFAFPIWTFGIIAGAIWAEEAWGRYWGWDPKETWSLITWFVYAGYLHARVTAGWRGYRSALLATLGFISLLITYYAVNLWIAGLHSYG